MPISVTLFNQNWSHGVNVDVRQGPDNGQDPVGFQVLDQKRFNNNESKSYSVSDGFDLWYRRDQDPDHPTVPPTYKAPPWEHVRNSGQDETEVIA